jgi:mannosyltransferase
MTRNSLRRWEWLGVLLLIALALGLRLYRLDAQSLWNDEGTSVALALRDLPTITRNAASDIHPPLYYYLLHGWLRLAGVDPAAPAPVGEAAARSLSALVGVGIVAATYLFARRFFGPLTALLAGLLVAISPFQIYYAQEARMYILVTLFGLLSMLAYARLLAAWETASARQMAGRAALYLLATALAIYSHYFAFALLAAQNIAFVIWLLARNRPDETPGMYATASPPTRINRSPIKTLLLWAGLQACVGLAYAPWLALSWRSLKSWPAVSAPLSLLQLLRNVAHVFSVGLTLEQGGALSLLALASAALIVPGLLDWGRRARMARLQASSSLSLWERETTIGRGVRDRSSGSGLILTLLYLIVPILTMYALSLQRPMYKPKFLLLATPAYYILQAWGITTVGRWLGRITNRRWLAAFPIVALTALACLPVAASLQNLYFDSNYRRDDYRGIVKYIQATAGPQDAILINAPSQIETVDLYYRGPLPEYPLPLSRPLDPAQTEAALQDIVARHPRVYGIFWATDESDPQRFVEGWLDSRCFKTMDSWFGNVRLVVYAVPQATPAEAEYPTDYVWGERIRLRGYSLLTPDPASGDIVQLTLFWEALAPIDRRYKVFTHLVDGRGNIVGQRDSEPAGGSRPTDAWQPGEIIADNYGLLIPAGTPPGEHTLRVGWYGADDGQRLTVSAGDQPLGDSVELAQITLRSPQAPPPAAALDIEREQQASWGSAQLIGHSLRRLGFEHEPATSFRPGEGTRLVLFWQREGNEPPPEGFYLALEDRRRQTVWEQEITPLGGLYPPAQWQQGEVLRDIQQVFLPPTLVPGTYRLTIRSAQGEPKAHTLQQMVIKP